MNVGIALYGIKEKECINMNENNKIENYNAELRVLRSELLANTSEIGDWKVVKCMEANLLGNTPPYDIEALSAERQNVRDRINELEVLIKKEMKKE